MVYSSRTPKRHIVGIVVDPEGKPVAEAHIDHSNDRLQAHKTDSAGRFELDTRAPIFVIRKAGFRSELIQTQDSKELLRITLQKLGEKRPFPTCSKSGWYVGIEGWEATLQFLPVSGVKASPQSHDIDYGARSYYIKTKIRAEGYRAWQRTDVEFRIAARSGCVAIREVRGDRV